MNDNQDSKQIPNITSEISKPQDWLIDSGSMADQIRNLDWSQTTHPHDEFWLSIFYSPIFAEKNRVAGIQLTAIDITAQKQLEVSLREKEDRLNDDWDLPRHHPEKKTRGRAPCSHRPP